MAGEIKPFLIIKKINRIMGIISGIGLICLSSVTFFEIIARKVFKSPTLWSFDISIYLFLLISFFAFTFTMQEDGHIGFSYFVERAKRTKIWSKVLTIFSGIFGITFCFLFFLENFRIMRMAIKFNWLTRGQIQIPVLYLYIIMSVGSLMLLITFLMKIVMGLFDLKEYGSSTEYLGRTLE